MLFAFSGGAAAAGAAFSVYLENLDTLFIGTACTKNHDSLVSTWWPGLPTAATGTALHRSDCGSAVAFDTTFCAGGPEGQKAGGLGMASGMDSSLAVAAWGLLLRPQGIHITAT